MGAPGFLAVFSDPGSEATLEEFQDWYDNEHVPLRLNHLHSFLSGARYAAADDKRPEWLAMYEVDDVSSFQDPSYTILRQKRSDREGELLGRLGVLDRRTSEVIKDTGGQPEKSSGMQFGDPSKVVVTFGLAMASGEISERVEELTRRSSSLPGWIRTRFLKVFDKGVTGKNELWTSIEVPDYLGVIELTSKLPVGIWDQVVGPELPTGISVTDWRQWGIYRAYPGVAQGNVEPQAIQT